MEFLLLFSFTLAQVLQPPLPPQAALIDPIPRSYSGFGNKSPCGGPSKHKSHALAEGGTLLPVSLMVNSPAEAGNCTVRLANANDFTNYAVLRPRGVTDEWFPCGRQHSTQQTTILELPEHLNCHECSVQVIWQTFQGNFFSCADLQVQASGISDCEGKCKNGGQCLDGLCLCKVGYTGQYCGEKDKKDEGESSSILGFFLLFVFLVILASFLGLCVYWYMYQDKIPPAVHGFLQEKTPWILKNEGGGEPSHSSSNSSSN